VEREKEDKYSYVSSFGETLDKEYLP